MSFLDPKEDITDIKLEVECADGKHEIIIRQEYIREIKENKFFVHLYVDNTHIQTFNNSGKLIKKINFNFECGGETLTLVRYGGPMDIVHRGMLVKRNKTYCVEMLPWWYYIFTCVLALSTIPFLFMGGLYISYAAYGFAIMGSMAYIGCVCNFVIKNSPFFTKKKKYLYCLIWPLLVWTIAIVLNLFPLIAA